MSVKNRKLQVRECLEKKGMRIAPFLGSDGLVLGIASAPVLNLYSSLHAVPQDLWAVTTTRSACPVESSYELAFANHLERSCRAFTKPMYLVKEYPFLPDFVLLDCPQGPVPVEIYGVTGVEDYAVQKALKQRFYRTNCYVRDVTTQATLAAQLEHHPLPSKGSPETH